ncbi:YgdB family protein [Serratia sp. L9]|uniref:YgdB family protein n=1 Tax=Serratia sp. L9 TaxID=3423946 RepID=UPI003D676951
MTMHRQHGGSTLAAVMLMLVMGLMLLTAQQRQLDSALLLVADRQHYLKAYNQAASGLSWGLAQSWPRGSLQATSWYCLQQSSDALQTCARLSSRSGVVVVRGAGEIAGAEPVWLYQLATEAPGDGSIKLTVQKGGWLDFCPEKRATDCDD